MTTISTIENDPARGETPPAAVDAASTEPDRNCPLCPRLSGFREANRARAPEWFNAPVPSFGDPGARLLIVGLAPGLQGANRTGRPFTGDFAGDLLYATLLEYGFARGSYQARPDDGLSLVDCRISNAVRCVPPQNKPLPAEINCCRPFLSATIAAMPRLRVIVVLGRVAHEIDDQGVGHPRLGGALCAWRGSSGRRRQTLRQLSLLALQHQHRRADGADVSRGVRQGQSGLGVVLHRHVAGKVAREMAGSLGCPHLKIRSDWLQPSQHIARILVGRKYRIEHVGDARVIHDQRQPLY